MLLIVDRYFGKTKNAREIKLVSICIFFSITNRTYKKGYEEEGKNIRNVYHLETRRIVIHERSETFSQFFLKALTTTSTVLK